MKTEEELLALKVIQNALDLWNKQVQEDEEAIAAANGSVSE